MGTSGVPPLPDAERAGLGEALAALLPDLAVERIQPWGSGHIHRTYLVEGRQGGAARFVAQRINVGVFGDPEALARNLESVIAHLDRGGSAPAKLRLARSSEGTSLVRDVRGQCWRAFAFVEHSRSIERVESPAQAERLARAFGAFLADLGGLDPRTLTPLLPGFHDFRARRRNLEEAARRDARQRASRSAPELAHARALWERLDEPSGDSDLPERVVHNDCKLNNLLIDERSGEPLCVVDLDTVMPGQARFDFGELVRTAAATAAEDEPDPSRVGFDLEIFRALARGFVAGARGCLAPAEIRSLALAGPRMALENGMRFLTDHVDGDVYFPAGHPGHNLERARSQLVLCERMLAVEAELRSEMDFHGGG